MSRSEQPDPNAAGIASLVRAFELNDGFQTLLLAGPSEKVREFLIRAVGEASRARSCIVRWIGTVEEALESRADEPIVPVLLVMDLSTIGDVQLEARILRLAASRDTLRVRRQTTLVLAVADERRATLAKLAPDFWSTVSRQIVVHREDWPNFAAFEQWLSAANTAFHRRLTETSGSATRYRHGFYTLAYELDTVTDPPSLARLKAAMSRATGWTGWRPWWVPTDGSVRATSERELDCWMYSADGPFPDPAHSDYWRASPYGRFFLVRGYTEDSAAELPPGSALSLELQALRIGEALAHARQMAAELGGSGAWIHFHACWSGLGSRRLTDWPSEPTPPFPVSTTSVGTTAGNLVVPASRVDDEIASCVQTLLAPLYDAFLAERGEQDVATWIRRFLRGAPQS
ncbi:MAG: hypothetical protein IAG13_00945 [Deltaproteobacteria bacterium]|nr:hypothetical protein [Nannocystaceae bacterium]